MYFWVAFPSAFALKLISALQLTKGRVTFWQDRLSLQQAQLLCCIVEAAGYDPDCQYNEEPILEEATHTGTDDHRGVFLICHVFHVSRLWSPSTLPESQSWKEMQLGHLNLSQRSAHAYNKN